MSDVAAVKHGDGDSQIPGKTWGRLGGRTHLPPLSGLAPAPCGLLDKIVLSSILQRREPRIREVRARPGHTAGELKATRQCLVPPDLVIVVTDVIIATH